MTQVGTEETEDPSAEEVYLLPASVSQQRFWALEQFQPGNPALNMPLALRLRGRVDVPALQRALQEVVLRHETLRTTFVSVDGKLMQAIAPERTMDLALTDLTDVPEAEREARAEEVTHREAAQPLSTEKGPLFVARLVKIAEDHHILLLTLHHIICDGWSNGVLVHEIGTLYTAFVTGHDPRLPELPLQFADFAGWQLEWLEKDSGPQVDFWTKRFSGKLPLLNLPTDHPRPNDRLTPGDIETLLFSNELVQSLQAFCRQEDCTMFMVYLAAYNVLLNLYTDQTDLLIGSPTANRRQVELEPLIGLFSNLMIFRCDVSGQPTFREVLARVRDLSLAAFAHSDLPFERLMETIPPDPERGRTPLLRTNFIYQRAFMQPMELPDLHLTPLRSVSPGALFDIQCAILDRAEGSRVQVEYNTALFDRSSIVRLIDHYRRILEKAVADPTGRPTDWNILTPEEADEMARKRARARQEAAPGDSPAERTAYAAARNPMEARLTEIWQEVMGIGRIGIHDDFFALGGHSLLAIRLFARIEQEYGQALPLATLFRARTIAQLSDRMSGGEATRFSNLIPIRPNGHRPPLFCLHRNDGIVMCYDAMAQYLGQDQPVYGIETEMLHGAEIKMTGVEEMAAKYLQEIVTFYPSGPYLLAGSSFGGILAFEIAQQLHRQGREVALLALLDTFAPVAFQQNLFAMPAANRMPLHLEAMREMDVRHKLQYVLSGVKKKAKEVVQGKETVLDVDTEKFVPETLREIQKVADQSVLHYHPDIYPGRMVMFRATVRNNFSYYDPDLWWKGMAAGGMEIIDIPGNHLGMLKEPNVRQLAAAMEAKISEALTNR
ncbi:MAG: condensation domain-containing protein [Capsulimonadales bacterium]|nr:condensation domain-containing protein [Capsulimonadales bacterium]